ncbi:MAG: tetratricopeptide (TPR) repeat protein [Flavobacteriales bacterium]|jgi:tetratricopeptide (TPR) repeat protein
MKNLSKWISCLAFLTLFIGLESCVNFKSGRGELIQKSSSENIEELFQEAYRIEATASSAESVLLLIDAFKKVEQTDPNNYQALWKIGNYNILMGAAHAKNTKEKKEYYREAIKYCEKAMSTNETFSTEVKKVKDLTEAIDKLSLDEVDAMGYWYTARFYYFKECLNPLGRAVNTKIVIQNSTMIERIDELDPNWAGGGNYFSRALYYIAVPVKFGGSKERANDEFSKAIEVGPGYLFNRWGRAKYLYDLTGDLDGFKSDLEWVLAQNPSNGGKTYPWNMYIQEDARKMLDGMKQ